MKKNAVFLVLSCLVLSSCFPTKIAPSIENYRVMKGKRLNRSLERKQYYVFENNTTDEHLFNFLDLHVLPKNYMFYTNIPVYINNNKYYVSFIAVEAKTEIINLLPGLASAIVNEALNTNMDESSEINETFYEYVAISVHNDQESDCLKDKSLSKPEVLKYLSKLKDKYLSSPNPYDALFKM